MLKTAKLLLSAIALLAFACGGPAKMENLNEPRIVVRKAARTLELLDGDRVVKTYKIGLGFAPEGDKERSGDGRTPEGEFYVFVKNDKSKYFRSLGVSYPSDEDALRGLAAGLITPDEHDSILTAISGKKMPPQKTELGGEIYVHGGGSSKDWTWGCIALEDEEMGELFDAVPATTRITILP